MDQRFSLTQILQVWTDDGDGMEALRLSNASWVAANHTEEETKGFLNHNPKLGFYQLVYGLIIIGLIIIAMIAAN